MTQETITVTPEDRQAAVELAKSAYDNGVTDPKEFDALDDLMAETVPTPVFDKTGKQIGIAAVKDIGQGTLEDAMAVHSRSTR